MEGVCGSILQNILGRKCLSTRKFWVLFQFWAFLSEFTYCIKSKNTHTCVDSCTRLNGLVRVLYGSIAVTEIPQNTAITPVDLSVWTMRALGEREPATPVWGKLKKTVPTCSYFVFPSLYTIYFRLCVTQVIDSYTQTYAAPIDVYLLKSLCRCCSCINGNLTIVDICSKWTNNNLVRQ